VVVRTVVGQKVGELFQGIMRICLIVREKGQLPISWGGNEGRCVIRNANVSLIVAWRSRYLNISADYSLTISEWATAMPIPSERRMFIVEPTAICETIYMPDLSIAREYGWKTANGRFMSSANLADECVKQFINLALRFDRGEVTPFSAFGGHRS